MGEVYRARDTKLKRDVALKVLPEAFARDPDRMARFQRQAQLLASLNHPNIAHLYGIEERALVMELVEGPTLPCPVPVQTALNYAKQIAAALEYAHEKGVVHRDLKPANIKITPEGPSGSMVKVLDFGLAKAVDDPLPSPGAFPGDASNSPTLTLGATRVGMILGTAAYMSPEQASGHPVDRRADIWSFGAVLYEMLAGKRAFPGESAADTLATVLKLDPDWDALPAETPASIAKLLRRCLAKDRKQRLQAIGEARIALEHPDSPQVSGTGHRFLWPVWPALVAALTLALAALAFVHFREKPPAAPIQRFEIAAPSGPSPNPPAVVLSPDGSRLLFTAPGPNGVSLLWLRPLDSVEAHPLNGTEGVNGTPFWSPDSRQIVFAAGGKLKKIDSAGGSAQVLCDAVRVFGGFWTPDGKIVFSASPGGPPDLFEVPEAGGTPTPLPGVDRSVRELRAFPVLLPDGRHFVYMRQPAGAIPAAYLVSLLDVKPGDAKPENSRKLLANAQVFAYAPSPDDPNLGYLIFHGDTTMASPVGTLMAQPFDLRKLEITGEPVPLAGRVSLSSASRTGILVYRVDTGSGGDQLTAFDRQGNALQTIGEPGRYLRIFFSPDGTRAVAMRVDQAPTLWMFDLTRGLGSRFMSDPALSDYPVFSPDGSRVAFVSLRSGKPDLYQRLSNGGGEDELLFKSDQTYFPLSWSHDGRFLLIGAGSVSDGIARVLRLDDKGKAAGDPFLFVRKGLGIDGQFSPDPAGPPHWVAYQSNRSGRYEIYLLPFDPNSPTGAPATAGEWQVSTGGGTIPRWNPNAKELFFLAPDGTLMAADLTGNPKSPTGLPKPVFKPKGLSALAEWAVSPDGKKFLFPIPIAASTTAAPFTVVLNWTSLLKK